MERTSNLAFNGSMRSTVLNRELDRVWRAISGLNTELIRSMRVTATGGTTERVDLEASKYLGTDASGNVIMIAGAASTIGISSFMETLVDDATAAAGRTTLGAFADGDAITGGTIDGAPIGGTTPAAGAFTTLGASGAVSVAGDIVHTGDTNTKIAFTPDDISLQTDGAEVLGVQGEGVEVTGGILINERADHANTPAAGKGEFWVKDDAPTSAMFTDDADTDHRLIWLYSSIYDLTNSGADDTGLYSFTSLPAGLTELELIINDAALDGTDHYFIRLSTGASFLATGYDSGSGYGGAGGAINATAGFILGSGTASHDLSGVISFRKRPGSDVWVGSGVIGGQGGGTSPQWSTTGGQVDVAGTLDGIRFMAHSSDNFNNGEIWIRYR